MSIRTNNNSILYLLTILTLLILINNINTKQVSSFNLLLPTSYHSTKGHARQIVITSGGCYSWQSTQSSIVRVTGTHHGLVPSQSTSKNPSCNSNGIVQLVHEGKYSASVYITAQDQDTKQLMSIPVRIRDLKRISIFTKSKIMNIRQIQNLQLYGFDAENNTFTSLQGLRFKWTITQINDQKYSVGSVQKIPLAESSLYMPFDTRKKIQAEQKVETDLFVIRALRVGKVSVKVRCLQPNYQLITDDTTLFIQQKFDIWPSQTLNLLAGSKFQYKLMTPTGKNISIPSPNYKITLSNNLFSVTDSLVISAPLKDSNTALTVSDTRTLPAYEQTVHISSYQPDQIQILVPDQLIIGQQLKYNIKFYKNKKLLQGIIDPILLNIKMYESSNQDPQGLTKVFILDRFNNKILSGGKGSGQLQVQYNGLSASKKITSVTPLKIISSTKRIVLPVGEVYQLHVVGGSGSYKYVYNSKNDQSLLSLSMNGLITTKKQGITQVTIVDQKNQGNKIQVLVAIYKIGQLSSLQKYKQFNLLQDDTIYLSARPIVANEKFTQCNDALLKGVTFTPNTPLQIIKSDPINLDTLAQLHKTAEQNKFLQKTLSLRKSINSQEIQKDLKMYIKYKQIKQIDIDKILLQMENLGLCAKLLVKPVSVYDGQMQIKKYGEDRVDAISNKFRMRTYDNLRTDILKTANKAQYSQINIMPLGTFKWTTKGGPYKWQNSAIGQMQVYLNGIKIDNNNIKKYEDLVYPTMTCPDRQTQNTQYILTYKNTQSAQLLRPVKQQIRIIISCKYPDLLRIGLPSSRQSSSSSNFNHSLRTYVLSNNKSSYAIYLLPGQCFRISMQPLLLQQNKIDQFYNASNVQFKIQGAKFGEIQYIEDKDSANTRPWNVKTYKYETKNRKNTDRDKDDTITIIAKQVKNLNTNEKSQIPDPKTFTVNIKSVLPLSVQRMPKTIDIPNLPTSKYVLQINSKQGPNRFSIKCDESIVNCIRQGNNLIITPQGVDRTSQSKIIITDQYTLDRPEIIIPVKVSIVNGLDLWVSRPSILQKFDENRKVNKPIDKNKFSTDTWIINGEQFITIIDVYSLNESSKSYKIPMGTIDPKLIQVTIDKPIDIQIRQISRSYDSINNLVIILYQASKIGTGSTSRLDRPKTIQSLRITAFLKHKGSQGVRSNSATIEVYNPIQLNGVSSLLPYQQLQIDNTKKKASFVTRYDSLAYVMESCSTILQITGGPSQIKTRIISNNGQGTFYQVIKLSQKMYRIDTIQATTTQLDYKKGILGNQKNLLTISAYTEEQHRNQLPIEVANIRLLIFVAPIKNIHIRGNNKILINKQLRYIVQFGEEQKKDQIKVIKQECTLKYKWSTPASQGKALVLTSDIQKIGVNVTAKQYHQGSLNNNANLFVVVYNKHDREIGKSNKNIAIYDENKIDIIPESNQNYHKNKDIVQGNDQILLIPPYSGLRLPRSTKLQLVCPCSQTGITISQQNQLLSQQPSEHPQLIKLTSRSSLSSSNQLNMPTYANIQITDICSVIVQNVDGAIIVSPNSANARQTSANIDDQNKYQYVHFYMTDCYGRKFLHHDYKNIEYRGVISDQHVASTSLHRVKQGLIAIQGNQIGHTHLIFQVILNGISKAKDVMPVLVNVFIQPSKPLSVHLGDVINFKAPQSIINGQKWTTSDNSILKVNPNTGQAIAVAPGQSYIKLGAFSTRIKIVKIIDLQRRSKKQTALGYQYEPIYSGDRYGEYADAALVQDRVNWRCQIVSREKQYFRLIAKKLIVDGKQIVRCIIQKIPGTQTIQSPVKNIKLRITAENANMGFTFSKQFEQQLDTFIILSERLVNPREHKHRNQKKPYLIVVQTSQRLQVSQRGGRQNWILGNEFNGARQLISVDLNNYKTGDWRIYLTNPRTKQQDSILISNVLPEQNQSNSKNQNGEQQKGGWKWTDWLVIFMGLNFVIMLLYQILQNNSGSKSKSY